MRTPIYEVLPEYDSVSDWFEWEGEGETLTDEDLDIMTRFSREGVMPDQFADDRDFLIMLELAVDPLPPAAKLITRWMDNA